ncbi:hypothetical protein MTAT_04510 [Moorella thermoacetica]|uniref:DNA primase small subunit n=1 Tax=Neomoorella thermoacetica TaxID=1525 RepID=A0AAC9MVE7_NEOTH|nr:hypothetical protein [Moorella thermoacetica]AOQ24750.1 DNA primase small subunit [Moorella thermoacetica]TYL15712.1 hypothetical protein MTAT_04510 [Moorella thermoacetica]
MAIIEFGAKTKNGFIRNIFTTSDKIPGLIKKYNNTDVFTTVLEYDSQDLDKAQKYGPFYMDFDGDLGQVRGDVFKACAFLKVIFGIPMEYIQLYFSGRRGIHLLIPPEVFALKPRTDLHLVYHAIATDIDVMLINHTADLQIYDCRRLFRIPNSRHGRTNLYKIPITYNELCGDLNKLAIRPRELPPVNYIRIPRAAEQIQVYIKKLHKPRLKPKYRQFKEIPPCVKYILDNPPSYGMRNNTAIALASYFAQQGWQADEILGVLLPWSQTTNPPMTEKEVQSICLRAPEKLYRYGCNTFASISNCSSHCSIYRSG